MVRELRFDELEERIAPTVVAAGGAFAFEDSDGNWITVSYDGPGGSQIELLDAAGLDMDNGDDIGSVIFTGADLSSTLIIGANASDATINLRHGISAPDQDVGTIAIGLGAGGANRGEVILGDDFAVDIGGDLGQFAINGDLEFFDASHSIQADGDIGIVYARCLFLAPSVPGGIAHIAAGGPAGGGNIGIILVTDGLYVEFDEATPVSVTGGVATIHDDAGTGDSSLITLRLAGADFSGEYYAVNVDGGGSVLTDVFVGGLNTSLSITTSATAAGTPAGDIGYVWFAEATPGVTISGLADTDVALVWGDGSVGKVTNAAAGGDIGGVGSGGDVGLIQTGKLGVLGSINTGAGNSIPVSFYLPMLGVGTYAAGDITSIKVGAVAYTDVEAATIGSVSAGPGGIRASDIIGSYGIGSVASKGPVVESSIQAWYYDEGLGEFKGGSIGTFVAPLLVDSNIEAYGSISSAKIAGHMSGSSIATHLDYEGALHYGGSLGSITVGGMRADSSIISGDDIVSLKVGADGIDGTMIVAFGDVVSSTVMGDIGRSTLDCRGVLANLRVNGDVVEESSIGGGTIGTLKISGGLYNSAVESGSGGAGNISVGGLFGELGGISIDGSVNSLTVNGGVSGAGSDKITVTGTASTVAVNGPVYSAIFNFGSVGTMRVSKSVLGGAVTCTDAMGSLAVGGSAFLWSLEAGAIGSLSVKGVLSDSDIWSHGTIGTLSAGSLWSTHLDSAGNMGKVTVGAGGVDNDSLITCGGDFAGLGTKGLIAGAISVGGDLTGSILSAGNDATEYNDIWYFLDANGQLTLGGMVVGGSIGPLVKIS